MTAAAVQPEPSPCDHLDAAQVSLTLGKLVENRPALRAVRDVPGEYTVYSCDWLVHGSDRARSDTGVVNVIVREVPDVNSHVEEIGRLRSSPLAEGGMIARQVRGIGDYASFAYGKTGSRAEMIAYRGHLFVNISAWHVGPLGEHNVQGFRRLAEQVLKGEAERRQAARNHGSPTAVLAAYAHPAGAAGRPAPSTRATGPVRPAAVR